MNERPPFWMPGYRQSQKKLQSKIYELRTLRSKTITSTLTAIHACWIWSIENTDIRFIICLFLTGSIAIGALSGSDCDIEDEKCRFVQSSTFYITSAIIRGPMRNFVSDRFNSIEKKKRKEKNEWITHWRTNIVLVHFRS
jgi:hypothetical protein